MREAGPDLPLLVHHAACDARASGGPQWEPRFRKLRRVMARLLELHDAMRALPTRPLLGGRDVMERLGLSPGPQVGEILDRVRRLQEEGTLSTREQALSYLMSLR